MDDHDLKQIREIIHTEMVQAQRDGRLLSDSERIWLRNQIEHQERIKRFWTAVAQRTVGWLIIAVLGGIGLAIWEWLRAHLGKP